MYKNCLLVIVFAISGIFSSYAQVCGGGTPISLQKFAPVELIDAPYQIFNAGSINRATVESEDLINDSKNNPYRVGINLSTNLSTLNAGNWFQLPNGTKIWRLGIRSKGAQAIALYFSQNVHLPIGSTLYAYNESHSQIVGSFDHNTPAFAALQMVEGEMITLEYSAPAGVTDLPVIPIEYVVHFYRGVEDFVGRFKKGATPKAENCQVDVMCSEGTAWQNQIRSVVHYTFTQGASTYVCSASTVNNTALDCKPYILTAWHCGEPTAGTNISTWTWYWRYQKATCSPGSGNQTDPSPGSYTMTGGTVRASSGNGTLNNPPGANEVAGSDFYLVELGSQPPATYQVYYAGWDRSNTAATSGVSIHHPAGSAKKISTFTSSLSSATYNGGAAGGHWQVVWAATANGHGVTEGGSSGSPIFNQSGRVVGQLSGGSSYCTALTSPDLYGKFYTDWDLCGTANNARLKPWLDPGNTGLTVLDGSSYPCSGVVADFTAPQTICAGGSVTFTNTSTGNPVPNSWSWTFAGGTPATSTAQNPTVTYSTPGTYDVTLVASNGTNNDTETKVGYITVVASTSQALPLVEGFTTATFPPTNWTLINLNSSATWQRVTTAGVAPTAGNSMRFNNYSVDDSDDDEVRTPKLDFSGLSSATLTFDVAYAPYNTSYYDGLEVLISTNCGGTFTSVYSKSNTTLATASATTSAFVPTAAQWRNETVNLTPYIGQPGVVVAFRNLSGNGNHLYVDNINISGVTAGPPTASFTASPTTACTGQTVTFTNSSTGATSYSWTFTGGTPATSTATNPTVTYASAGTYTVSLTATNANGSTTSTQTNYITVIAAPATPGSITGTSTICSGSTANTYSIAAVSGATSYTWSVPSGSTITSGQGTTSITMTAGSTSGNVTVTATNTCGTSTASSFAVTINSAPATPGTITGSASVCSGSTGNVYSISAVAGATSYTWTVPAGATITAGQGTTSATVTFGATAGNVTVTATNACGTSSASIKAITIITAPATPGTISGGTSICSGSTGNVYSISAVSGATSYTWTVPAGATITAGQGTTSATVTMGATSGNVTVTASNACGTSSASTLSVTVMGSAPATPGAITGTTTVCSGSTGNVYSITSIAGATSYTWTVPAGATITTGQGTTSATVTFGSTSGNITVTASSSCGTSAASSQAIIVNTAPVAPGTITGTSTLCAGSTGNVYSISAVSGATSYTWTVPAGSTITAGQGTTSATVTFGATSGNVSVTATNACGTSSASNTSITINTAPATPGTISGSVSVCSGSAGNVYTISSVSGATSYTWTVPAGATITSGQGTTSATVTFGATSGNVSVTATNSCGTSSASTRAVTVNAIPSAPVVTVSNNCGNSVLSTVASGSLLWSTGATTSSITVSSAGTYTVTQTVNGCTSASGSGTAAPLTIPPAPAVTVTNNCGSTVLSATVIGSVIWNTGATTSSITVTSAGTYTVTQMVGGCTSPAGSGVAFPTPIPSTPVVTVTNNCGSSLLTSNATGTVLWSTGATTPSITVSSAGTYTVTQTVSGCTSAAGSGTAAPISIPSAPSVSVTDNCGSSVLTASGSGSFLWSTSETTASITVASAGTYTVTQTVNGCTSPSSSGVASPLTIPSTPIVSVTDNCGSSALSTTASGTLLWSTGENTPSITVTAAGPYTVTQTSNGCTSAPGSGTAAPITIPSAPVVSVSDNCGNTILTATGTGTFLWSNSQTTQSITVTTPGTYTVTQTVNGCTSATGSGIATPLTIPTVTLADLADVCINTTPFTLSGGSPTGGTYSGTGVNADVFDPSVAGFGTFVITYDFTDVNGCSASAQNTINVGCEGVEEKEEFLLHIYPNPSTGKFHVSSTDVIIDNVTIYDAAGRLVQIFENNSNGISMEIDLNDHANGVYSLDIMADGHIHRKRISLNK